MKTCMGAPLNEGYIKKIKFCSANSDNYLEITQEKTSKFSYETKPSHTLPPCSLIFHKQDARIQQWKVFIAIAFCSLSFSRCLKRVDRIDRKGGSAGPSQQISGSSFPRRVWPLNILFQGGFHVLWSLQLVSSTTVLSLFSAKSSVSFSALKFKLKCVNKRNAVVMKFPSFIPLLRK